MMRKTRLFVALFATSLSFGCAHRRDPYGTADTSLGLSRVVLYRSGIGYFERHGQVDDDLLRIRVRRDQVDDLLKSLTVVDRSTGQAISVSMPLDPETWASAALASLDPGEGSLADLLDNLRGTRVVLTTLDGRARGRIVMVEEVTDEPSPEPRRGVEALVPPRTDHKITLLEGDELEVVWLSKVRTVTLQDGDLAMQLNRRLDASAGEGMFQQIEVAIALTQADQHDLSVSYVVAAPMWKPTYRVVLPNEGKGEALLQGWAVVDNTSGEDWRDVTLSLTSGEPIAFEYDLHTPRTVDRADLTEAGVRKRARVAVGETTYDYEDDEAAPPPPAGAPAADEKAREYAEVEEEAAATRAPKKRKSAAPRSSAGGMPGDLGGAMEQPAPEPAVDFDALRRSTLASARSKKVSGMTRFDLNQPVTVPNGSSTMVAVVNASVQAEETFLYRPGGAGTGYESNPYRVVRFENTTPFVLEPGPISIYSGGSFVGEGLSEAVGTNTSATIPFAVEPSILVTSSTQSTGDDMRLLRIVRGVLEVETFSRRITQWSVKGPPAKDGFAVLVRHSKAGWNYALKDSPKGTEELPDAYLVPVRVPAGKSEASATVVEQTPSKTTISIWDGRAVTLLEQVLVSAEVTPQMRTKLEPIVELRREIGQIDTEISGLQAQQAELDRRADETRKNLEATKKDAAAGALRAKLSRRLEEFTSQADAIGRKIVELQSRRLETKIQLEDLLANLDFEAPPNGSDGSSAER